MAVQMLVGERELDVDDWEANTETVGWARGDKVVRWFFAMLRRFPNAKRSQVLRESTPSQSLICSRSLKAASVVQLGACFD